jgi:hypothetical protein
MAGQVKEVIRIIRIKIAAKPRSKLQNLLENSSREKQSVYTRTIVAAVVGVWLLVMARDGEEDGRRACHCTPLLNAS